MYRFCVSHDPWGPQNGSKWGWKNVCVYVRRARAQTIREYSGIEQMTSGLLDQRRSRSDNQVPSMLP